MTTPKHDAAAVRRLLARADKLRRELAMVEADMKPHALRVCRANGYCVMLREEALRQLVAA